MVPESRANQLTAPTLASVAPQQLPNLVVAAPPVLLWILKTLPPPHAVNIEIYACCFSSLCHILYICTSIVLFSQFYKVFSQFVNMSSVDFMIVYILFCIFMYFTSIFNMCGLVLNMWGNPVY